MNVTKINLKNFRNFKKLKLDNLKKVNVIIGNNGTGKTSIIESIYMCSVGKSFRSNNDSNIVNSNTDNYKIQLTLKESKKERKLEMFYNSFGKKTKINTSIKKKLSDFIGTYKVLLFSPDEIRIIKDSPSSRRSYLNIQISQLEKYYLKYLNDYNKIVKSRNEFLKNVKIEDLESNYYLKVLDEKLIDLGFRIFKIRKEYLENLNKKIEKVEKTIDGSLNIKINYVSDFNDTKENVYNRLLRHHKRDYLNKMTSLGIHRDDFEFILNGKNAKEYASQGQQKMILLIMKLSELKIFKNTYKYNPILLLDDLFSELDIINRNKLIDNLGKDSQIFITTTDVSNIKNLNKINIIDLNKLEVENE